MRQQRESTDIVYSRGKGSTTVVAVLACADLQLAVVSFEDGFRHTRVVQQSQRIVSRIGEAVEPVLLDAHAQRNGSHDLHMQPLARFEETQHLLFELRRLLVPRGPHIRHQRLIITADFHAFLQIRHSLAHLSLCACLLEHNEFLAALCDVAAVGCRGVPRQRILLWLGACKELCRVGENGGDSRGRDAVVFKVDKAGGLEAGQDGVRCLLLRGCIAGEESGEVDELHWGGQEP